MIATLRIFAWFRWRVLANSLRMGERRDTIEQISRAASFVVPGLLVVTCAGSVLSASIVGWLAGWRSVSDFPSSVWILTLIRALLIVVTGLVALTPIFIGIHGGAGRESRLMLLPVPRGVRHFVEVVTSLLDPWVIFVLPGLVSYALGMTVGALMQPEPWVRAWAIDGGIALVAAVLVVGVLASLGSLTSFLVSWIVRDRRRGEIFVIVFIVLLGCVAIVPAFVSRQVGESFTNGPRRHTLPSAALRWTPSDWPAWTTMLPSDLYAEAVIFGYDVPRSGKVWPLTMLAIEGGVLYGLSAFVHGTLDQMAEGRRARKPRPMAGAVAVRLPGMWPGTSAVALAQVRTALRSVRGRLVVLLPGPLVAMIAMLFEGQNMPEGLERLTIARGYLSLGAGLLFGLYAAQAITLNQFASDRAGLTLEFLAPIRDIDLVRGKTVGCAVLIGAGAVISLICAAVVAPAGSPWLWIATIAGGAATFLVTSPLSTWISIALPVAADLSKTGAAGNPHTLGMLAGSVAIAVAAAPAAAILALFPPFRALVAMMLWLALTAVIARPLLGSAARLLRIRRENLALVAQGR
jgi:hypothetical protein